MPVQSVLTGDFYFKGTVTADSLLPSASSVADSQVKAYAGTGTAVQAAKLQQRFDKEYNQNESATLAVSESRVVHVVRGTNGTINDFFAGAVVPLLAGATCTVDLFKNGVSILAAPIALLSTDVAYAIKAGTLSSAAVVAGDVLEVKIIAATGGGTKPKGVFARLAITEDPS